MPFITVNDVPLYYEESGSGPPLVLLHGLGSSHRDWWRQVEHFRDRYRVITPDLRGHGRSATPDGPYSIPLFADDVAALLDALDAAPARVVGLSMGGMVAFQLAVSHPEVVKRLVIVNSAPEARLDSLRDYWIYWSRRLVTQVLGVRRTGQLLAERLFQKPEQGTLRQQFEQRWAENDEDAYLASIDAIAGWSVEEQIDQITCPALVVAADEDYTPVADKRAYVARMPDADLVVIPDSRHATPVEQAEMFNRELEQFLDAEVHS
jgi:pimeloyl-ACP methyl ester carboxylesterase